MTNQKLTIIFMGAAINAGKAILSVYNSDFDTFKKVDNSPVTKADQLAEQQIIQTIMRFCQDIPIIAEESVSAGTIPEIENRYILIDPLDGTQEFIARNGEFTVNIALIESGRPQCAVVFIPTTTEMFLCDGLDSFRTRINKFSIAKLEKISVRKEPRSGLKALVSRSHNNSDTNNFLNNLPVNEVVSVGSAIKFCRIAEGSADIYPRFSPTMQWDSAAGDCILSGAGGMVVDTKLEPLLYTHKGKCKQEDFINPPFIAIGDPTLLTRYKKFMLN